MSKDAERGYARTSTRGLWSLVAVVAAFLIAAPGAMAADRFVEEGGNDGDGNECLNDAQPCATVNHAVGESAEGDTIHVLEGIVEEDSATTIPHDLTIVGQGAGDTIVQLDADVTPGAWFETDASADLQIASLTLDGGATNGGVSEYGVLIAGGSSGAFTGVEFRDFDEVAVGKTEGDTGEEFIQIGSSSFQDYGEAGVEFATTDEEASLAIADSVFAGNDDDVNHGVVIGGPADAVLFRNAFQGHEGGAGSAGVHAFSSAGDPEVEIRRSLFTENAIGASADVDEAENVQLHGNRIVGNASGVEADTDVVVDARNNWWGCNEGPNENGCDTTGGGGTVNADPWLVLDMFVNPAQVAVDGGTATILAILAVNSDQEAATPAPDGTPVEFGTSLGSVDPESAVTENGFAFSQLTSGDETGTAEVAATVDGETVTTEVEFTTAPPPPPPPPPADPRLELRVPLQIGLPPFFRQGVRVRARCHDANRANMRLAVSARNAARAGIVPRTRRNPVFLGKDGAQCGANDVIDQRLAPRGRARQALRNMRPGARMPVQIQFRVFGPAGDNVQRERLVVRRPAR